MLITGLDAVSQTNLWPPNQRAERMSNCSEPEPDKMDMKSTVGLMVFIGNFKQIPVYIKTWGGTQEERLCHGLSRVTLTQTSLSYHPPTHTCYTLWWKVVPAVFKPFLAVRSCRWMWNVSESKHEGFCMKLSDRVGGTGQLCCCCCTVVCSLLCSLFEHEVLSFSWLSLNSPLFLTSHHLGVTGTKKN